MHIVYSLFLFVLTLPPFSCAWLAPFCLVPLLWHTANASARSSMTSGFVFGCILGAYVYLGIDSYSSVIYLICAALIGVIFSLYFTILRPVLCSNTLMSLILVPGTWLLLEKILFFINVPFSFSISISPLEYYRGLAAYGGALSLSALFVLLNVIVFLFLRDMRTGRYAFRGLLIITLSLHLSLIFIQGNSGTQNISSELTNLLAIQTSVHPGYTDDLSPDGRLENLKQYREALISRAMNEHHKTDLIVLPEVNIAKYEFRNPDNVTELVKRYNVAMLVSSPDLSPAGKSTNSVFAINREGKILDRVNKQILIPYFEDDLKAEGQLHAISGIPGTPGVLICFESVFTGPATTLVQNGAQYLVVVSNDAYAGPSFLPHLHAEFSRIRSVETGRYLMRVSNGGHTALYDQAGNILDSLPMYTDGHIMNSIPHLSGTTFYVRYSVMITALLTGYALASFILLMIYRPKKRTAVTRFRLGNVVATVSSGLLILFLQHFYAAADYNNQVDDRFQAWNAGNAKPKASFLQCCTNNLDDTGISASMSYLLRDHGLAVNIHTLSERVPGQEFHGLDEYIHSVLDKYNYHAEISLNAMENGLYVPSIIQLRSGDYGVIKEYRKDYVQYFSPSDGKIVSINREIFDSNWTGVSLRIVPRMMSWESTNRI